MQNLWFFGEIEYSKFCEFYRKLCTLYMYEMSGLAKKLNIQNCVNSAGNYEHCTYGMSRFADKSNIQNCIKYNENFCTLNVWTIWICGEIEYLKFHKFSRKLCTIYMYGIFGFAIKLNIQNNLNSMGNCVH